MAEIPELPPWWGYSKDHGWVVIDRTIPINSSGLGQDFLFFRCRDSMTFLDRRSRWAAPRYVYASTYIAGLGVPESAQAATELSQLKSQWPRFREDIRHQYETQEADRQQLEMERAESERLRLDAKKKELKMARKKKAS
jgi:hypothetical protein